MRRKSFIVRHSKSSAIIVSLIVHAVAIICALFFVAVTIIQKNDVDFEAKEIKRPKMNLRKLQVPVNVKGGWVRAAAVSVTRRAWGFHAVDELVQ